MLISNSDNYSPSLILIPIGEHTPGCRNSSHSLPASLKERTSVGEDDWDDVEDEKEAVCEQEVKNVHQTQNTGKEIVDYNEETNCFILSNGEVLPNTNNMPKESIAKMIQARTRG